MKKDNYLFFFIMKQFLLGASILLSVLGCSPYTLLESMVVNKADLSAYHTFRIASPDASLLPVRFSMRDFNIISNAVKTQMLMRGYKESPNADLLINIGIVVTDNIETKDAIPPVTPFFVSRREAYYRDYYQDAQVITGINKEGVLTIDMIDTHNDMYLYTASVGNLVDQADHKIKESEEVERAVAALFKNFPVKPRVGE